MLKPKLNQIWYYEKTGNAYLIQSNTLMKIDDSSWVEGVVYKCLKEEKIYTRDLKTFIKKFKATLFIKKVYAREYNDNQFNPYDLIKIIKPFEELEDSLLKDYFNLDESNRDYQSVKGSMCKVSRYIVRKPTGYAIYPEALVAKNNYD